MDGQNNSTFWPSYVDIMTTLFAIMLILFAVTFARFKVKEGQLEEKKAQLQEIVNEYDNILQLYSTVGKIDNTKYFGYNPKYLKHLFQINVEYQAREYAIDKLKLDKIDIAAAESKRDSIVDAGKLIQQTINELNWRMPQTKDNNIKFLIIIEGQSSKIPFDESAWKNNYTLSYLRAKYLNEFWKSKGIDFEKLSRCELLISGSGEGGVPRVNPDEIVDKSSYESDGEYRKQLMAEEVKNQRFLINIVPVLGNIDSTRVKIDKIKKQ